MKIKTFSMWGIASFAFLLSACGNAVNTTANNTTTNTTTKSNTAVAVNSNQTATTNRAAVSNTAPNAAGKSEADKIQGELQVGRSESVILYFGKESGDYAGYCFTNDSEAGRAILAACKDRAQCEVTGNVDYEGGCKVPGLEADLSAQGKILKVESAKSLGSQK